MLLKWTGLIFQEIFGNIDKNNDGTIEFDEFITVLDHPMVNLSRFFTHWSLDSTFHSTREEVRKSMEETVRYIRIYGL
jgi:Ca2+-binding EF-hand superfamily protein